MPPSPLSAVVRHIRALAELSSGATLPDRHLLERFIHQRDEAAFALLVRRHGSLVLRVARRILHDAHAAEDVFQSTFLTLARCAASIRKHDALPSWLYGVAARLASQVRAQEARRKKRERGASSRPSEDVMEAAAWRELGTVLDEEMQRLPERYRTPLVLIYFAGQTQEMAARQLDWSLGTLRRRLERGKRLLHDRLLRRGVSLSIGLLAVGIAQSAIEAALPASLIEQTVQEVVRISTTQATGWLIGAVTLAHAKIAMMLGLLLVAGAGLAMLPMASRQTAAEKPQAKTPPPGPEAKQARIDRFGDPLPEGAVARLGTMRFRHGNGLSVAFAADGQSLLTCGGDRTIHTWDLASGRLLGEQRFPGMATNLAVLSPDRRLLVFEELSFLSLWDVRSIKLRHKFTLSRQFPRVVFSPDSKWLVAAEEDGTLRVWDTATGKGRLLGRHKKEIHSLAFTADGTLMTQGEDQTVRFWNVAEGRERSRLALSQPLPQSPGAAISPDGRVLAVASLWDDKVRFWDTASGKPVKDWIAVSIKGRQSVQFSPDGKTVLIGTGDGGILWDPHAGKRIRTLSGRSGQGFTFSADGKSVASLGLSTGGSFGINESMVRVWDLTTSKSHAANGPERGHLGQVEDLAFAPDGRIIASASSWEDPRVCLWDSVTGRLLRSLPDAMGFHGLVFTPDGKDLLICTRPAVIRRDVAIGREVRHYWFDENDKNAHNAMVMHLCDDGRTLLALSQNLKGKAEKFTLHAWNAETGEHLRCVPLPVDGMWIGYSRFSPDGRLLATPSGSIRDMATGAELGHLPAAARVLSPVAFSADGALIALGVEELVKREAYTALEVVAVQIWETATLSLVARLATGQAAHVAFTPDDRRLIVAGPDALTLWDIASRRVLARRSAPGRFQGSRGPSFANSLALAPNGRTVATGQPDTAILLWDLSPPIADRPAAPLTAAQREAYWSDLAGADAGRAFAAIARLADAPAQALTMLRSRMKPARAPAADELRRLIADLDHARFERREEAMQRLRELAELSEAALREALRGKPSLEMRRRLDDLLAESRLARTPEKRRQLRAVRVLEIIGTLESRQVLEMLAEGAADSRLTQEAKAALPRLDRRYSAR